MARGAIRGAIILAAIGLAVAGCGRRGALEPPPQAGVSSETRDTRTLAERRGDRRDQAAEAERRLREREAEQAEHPYGKDWPYPPREKVIDVEPQESRPSGAPPKKSFFLDPLLN